MSQHPSYTAGTRAGTADSVRRHYASPPVQPTPCARTDHTSTSFSRLRNHPASNDAILSSDRMKTSRAGGTNFTAKSRISSRSIHIFLLIIIPVGGRCILIKKFDLLRLIEKK
jgi:hypothetical protein